MSEEINVTFIIPQDCSSEYDCTEVMQLAFTACDQHCGGGPGLQAHWVREQEWNKFEGLTKKDVFVLNKFEGTLYDRLKATKCLIVGPRCLSCCLTEGKPIPSGPEPVFTVAMRGLFVTASGLSKQKKDNIKNKVHWMGGIYNTVLTADTTHLISDTVLSDKYIKSVEKGIPIMCESWVEAVWDKSLRLNVSGASSDFDDHRLPPFANLQITTSGILKKDKQKIMNLVNANGGTFCGAFQSETTDIVVLTKDGIGSEKYKAALTYNKECVLPSWVEDSASRGVALPVAQYKVAGALTSSPLAEHRLPDMSLNFSRITNGRQPCNFVDESRASDMSTPSGKSSQTSKRSQDMSCVDKEILTAFDNFDMSNIKKAGPIFDGFCIWVTGLEGVCRDRATAIVSRGGGVRYDCPHDKVTHIVSGTISAAHSAMQALPNAPILSPIWLVKSVEAGRALDEAEFLVNIKSGTPVKSSSRKPAIEPASPMSKRNLQLLRREPLDLPPPTPEVELEPRQDDIVNHYLSQEPLPAEPPSVKPPDPVANMTSVLEQPDMTDDADELTEEMEQIFTDIKMEVQGLDEEAICEIGAEVASAGGALVAAGAGGTHVLVPLDFDTDELLTGNAEPVTVFWVKDCLSQQELLPIQYYHRPVKVPSWGLSPGPLHGVVASLSTYSGIERAFLDELAKLLGATTQLRFCRRNTANALASTHLICPTPTGDKYMGAVKWGLPAVRAEWLMHCVEEGRRVPEGPFLIGDTIAPTHAEEELEHIEEEQPEAATSKPVTESDKENEMLPPIITSVPRRGSVSSREHTPKAMGEMSPASRYIAMARQGLLGSQESPISLQSLKEDGRQGMARHGLFGSDSHDTPKRVQSLKENARQEGLGAMRTPPMDDALSTPNLETFSPTTRRRLQAVKRGEMPSEPIKTPIDPFERKVETPDSAFGAILCAGSGRLSPEARKRLKQVVDSLPSKTPETHPVKDKHTPLWKIRSRILAQFNSDAANSPSEHVAAAPRTLLFQEQSETPPAKMAKLSENHRAGGATIQSDAEVEVSTKSADSSSSSCRTLPAEVNEQLQRLDAAITGRVSQRARRQTRDSLAAPTVPETEQAPESQPNTVGWDDTTPAAVCRASAAPVASPLKRFMLSSNVDNREEIIEMIQYLGGVVSDSAELDPSATHLLCAAPGRSEKMLGSVAAGRWVLHPAYIPRSRTHGQFLPEEEFEWGNPKASCLPAVTGAERVLALAAHRWRSRRAQGAPGPFAGVVALLHVPAARRTLLARLVAAGDGLAPDVQPPYTTEDATVCFADIKRYPLSERDAAWLVSKRIPVCAPVLLSSYLTDEQTPNPVEHCLPDFRPH